MKAIKETLGTVLGRVAGSSGAARLLNPVWSQIVGSTVAKHAQPLGLTDGVLTVRCDSSAWREALAAERATILLRVKGALGEAQVSSIIFESP